MHRRFGYTLFVSALFCVSCVSSSGPVAASPQGDEGEGGMVAQAEVIFVGTVRRHAEPATSAAVLVEDLVRPGEGSALSGFEGREVTVLLRAAGSPPVGSRVTFFTRFASLGTELTLAEIGHEMVEEEASALSAPVADARAGVEEMIREEEDRALAARLADAAVIVVGRVSEVRAEGEAMFAGAVEESEPLSEHSPQWREAVIEVSETLKGGATGPMSSVVVRFASSRDVMWAAAPKFEVGQEGVFVVDEEDVMELDAAALALVQAGGELTDPGNFLAPDEIDRVKRLMGQ